MYETSFILPSDSKIREDLNAFLKNNEILAQENKEKLEEIQRKDRKNREKNK